MWRMPRTVLLVDEDTAVLAARRRALDESPYRVLSARGARPAFEVLAIEPVDVVVCGETLSEGTGIDFMARVRLRHPSSVRIVVFDDADTEARSGIAAGTVHISLSRAAGSDDLVRAIGRGLEQLDLLHETQRLLRAVRRQRRERPGCSPSRVR
jgi:DNA-binding NtrC family response regulator